jgi:hypothetical protein
MTSHLFTGLGPGQSERTAIGATVYERWNIYHDVPEDHLRRGGFLTHPPVLPDPEPVDDLHGVIVLGSAPCWREDLEAAREYAPDWPVLAVNGVGTLYLEPITAWCSIHGNDLVKWMRLREERGGNGDYAAYGNFSDKQEDGGAIRWNRPNAGGSSGLHGVELALEIGYERVLLCGMPLEGQERVRSLDGIAVEGVCPYKSYHDGWQRLLPKLDGCVKSMSGWTQKLLGKPTKGWAK